MRASIIRAPKKAGFRCHAKDLGCLVQVPEDRCLHAQGSGFRAQSLEFRCRV